jgi:hypothetical protein
MKKDNINDYIMITRISSDNKKIITFSDIHADIHSLIICLRDCAGSIKGTLSAEELETQLFTSIKIVKDSDDREYFYNSVTNEPYDISLGFSWIHDCNKCIVIIGDLIDGKRVGANNVEEHEYPQIEAKIIFFINALIRQGGVIYKILGNHEIINIIKPDETYLFTNDKIYSYMTVNGIPEYRTNFFKMNKIGYNALFYHGCYVLLQIDNNIFVHGQLVGENYSYYEIWNEILNYDFDSDIQHNFGTSDLIFRLTKLWFSILIIIVYKTIYVKNLIKWSELHYYYKYDFENIYKMVVKDVDDELIKYTDDKKAIFLKQQLNFLDGNIKYIHDMLYANPRDKITLVSILKPEIEKLKYFIISSYLNSDNSELWKRHYGFSTSQDPLLCKVVQDDLTSYNKFNDMLAERIVIGHCTQNIYTTEFKENTSYHTVIPSEDGMVERVIPPSKTGQSYYNDKFDNLIFGITMDCPHETHGTHRLYKVDVGASRGFDSFTNYKQIYDDIDYLNFLNFSTGCNMDCSYDEESHDQTLIQTDNINIDHIIKNFMKTFISRIPQVLEINGNSINIIRSTIKNIYMNQRRYILNDLLKNYFLMDTVQKGGGLDKQLLYKQKYTKYLIKMLNLTDSLL